MYNYTALQVRLGTPLAICQFSSAKIFRFSVGLFNECILPCSFSDVLEKKMNERVEKALLEKDQEFEQLNKRYSLHLCSCTALSNCRYLFY